MITELVRKTLLAGVGIQERFRELVDEFVKKGELSQSQGAKLIKEWTDIAEKSTSELNKSVSELVEKALQKMNLPTRDDVEAVNRKLQSLTLRVKRIEAKTESPEGPAPKEKKEPE
ncbi:MAG: phasin family protein [Nitrospiraceae bacterium]|nr:phasin family protein [Nitrospiraceae bacterium]